MSTTTDLPEFLTVEETAKMLRLHPRTIRNRIKAGLLPAKQVTGGKSKLIAKTDALALLVDVAPAPSMKAPLVIPVGVNPLSVKRVPPINPLATPEGRARAIEMLRLLREMDIDEEQAEEQSQPLDIEPISFRRWNIETGERMDDDE